MDLYGNITSVNYKISCSGTKNVPLYGELTAPLDADITQTYSYTNQNLLIPTVIVF